MLNVFSQHAYIGLHIFLVLTENTYFVTSLLLCIQKECSNEKTTVIFFLVFFCGNQSFWLIGPPGLTPFCYFEYRMYSWIHWIDCAHYSASFFLILTKGLRCIHWESSCNCLLIVRPSFTWQNSVLTKIYAYHELGKWLEHFGIEASLHSQNMIDVITMERE